MYSDDISVITSTKRRPIKGHLFQAANHNALFHIKGSLGLDWANRTSEVQPNADRGYGCLSQKAKQVSLKTYVCASVEIGEISDLQNDIHPEYLWKRGQ